MSGTHIYTSAQLQAELLRRAIERNAEVITTMIQQLVVLNAKQHRRAMELEKLNARIAKEAA